MTRIELEIHDDVIAAVNKIKDINDSGVELLIPEGAVIFDNILNLKILNKTALDRGITLQYTTKDEEGQALIDSLDEAVRPRGFEGAAEDPLLSGMPDEEIVKPKRKKAKVKMPKLKLKFKPLLIVVPLLLAGAVYGGYKYLASKHAANAKIYVKAQSLTRSVTIKVSATQQTSTENKILKGDQVTATSEYLAKIETTGEKIEGDKAEGKVIVYNKTSSEIKLKEGKEFIYKGDDTELVFKATEDVTIPEMAPEDEEDPGSPLIPGEAEIKIEAEDIGDQYNIDEGESLEIDDYDEDDLVAETSEDFEGGSSKTIKIVSEEDITALQTKITEENETDEGELLKKEVGKGSKFIQGSTANSVVNETFSHEVGDETDEVTLNQEIALVGLSYKQDDLDNLLDNVVADLVPEGFELSEMDRETKVEVMGNSTDSVLSSDEADIQVTLKAAVIPIINEDQIKSSLQGVSPQEAQRILGSLNNVETYEFVITPSMPLFRVVPKDKQKIQIEIIKNEQL